MEVGDASASIRSIGLFGLCDFCLELDRSARDHAGGVGSDQHLHQVDQ
jgi:hypothetical protein